MMHHHTTFAYKRSSGSEDIFQTKLDTLTDCVDSSILPNFVGGGDGGRLGGYNDINITCLQITYSVQD